MSSTRQVFHHSVTMGRFRYILQVWSDDLNEKNIPYSAPLRSMMNDVVDTHYIGIIDAEDRERVLRLAAEQVAEHQKEIDKLSTPQL